MINDSEFCSCQVWAHWPGFTPGCTTTHLCKIFQFYTGLKIPLHHPNQWDEPHKSPHQFNALLRQNKMFTVYLVGFFNSDIGAHWYIIYYKNTWRRPQVVWVISEDWILWISSYISVTIGEHLYLVIKWILGFYKLIIERIDLLILWTRHRGWQCEAWEKQILTRLSIIISSTSPACYQHKHNLFLIYYIIIPVISCYDKYNLW